MRRLIAALVDLVGQGRIETRLMNIDSAVRWSGRLIVEFLMLKHWKWLFGIELLCASHVLGEETMEFELEVWR